MKKLTADIWLKKYLVIREMRNDFEHHNFAIFEEVLDNFGRYM